MQHADLCSLLLRALRYEHWLRFHFMEDILSSGEDECMDAVLHVPEEQVELERRENPDLFPVLEFLQGRPLSMKLSQGRGISSCRAGCWPGTFLMPSLARKCLNWMSRSVPARS